MRQIHGHEVNGLNERIRIVADDQDPNSGNASHVYTLTIAGGPEDLEPTATNTINFQHGPILESGFNGFTGEALLAIVADRLRGFQSSKYSCRENAVALTKIEEALMWLQKRTRDRMARGVEGTHTV